MTPKKTLLIEIRDKRLEGGRLAISARTTNKVERRRREAALRTLLDQDRLDVIEELRARRLRIEDVQRAVETGDIDRLRPKQQGLTIAQAKEILLRKVEATRRPATFERYEVRLNDIERHFGADTPLTAVSTEQVEAYLHTPKGKRQRVWSANTQVSYKVAGQRLWAMVEGMEAEAAAVSGIRPRLRINPWQRADTPVIEATRAEFLLSSEWRRLELRLEGTPELALLAVMTLAGLRIGEARFLRPDVDVDLVARVIRIQAREGKYAWKPKTKRGSRDVPIGEGLLAILRAHGARGYAGQRFLFRLAGNDHPLPYSTARDWVRRSYEAAGIQYGQKADALTAHSLRHTFASWLAQRGVSVLVIAKLLGDTVDQVVTTYAHLQNSDLRVAIGVIDQASTDEENAAGVQQNIQ